MRKNLYGRDVKHEIRNLRYSLKAVDRSLRRLAPMLSDAVSLNGVPRGNGHSHPRLSAKARASLVLQGRYMGYVRQLKLSQKAHVRKIRQTKGVRAAIQVARRMGREWARV